MTPSELKYHTRETSPHFFDRKTMAFFGDSTKNFGVRQTVVTPNYPENSPPVEVRELYRKRPVMHGLHSSHYFRKDTFKVVFAAKSGGAS